MTSHDQTFDMGNVTARKQNVVKFGTYVAEQTHKLQNNSTHGKRKKLPKLPSFADSFTLRAFSSFLSLYNKNYVCLLVNLSYQFHNDKSGIKTHGDN